MSQFGLNSQKETPKPEFWCKQLCGRKPESAGGKQTGKGPMNCWLMSDFMLPSTEVPSCWRHTVKSYEMHLSRISMRARPRVYLSPSSSICQSVNLETAPRRFRRLNGLQS